MRPELDHLIDFQRVVLHPFESSSFRVGRRVGIAIDAPEQVRFSAV